ncbi:MAG: protease SohB [Calditrichaeota bacterium]|nr:MAG: protease SohB [Calditrichota bacterium]
MDFLFEYGIFLAEAITIVISIIVVLIVATSLLKKDKDKDEEKLEIINFNRKIKSIRRTFEKQTLSKKDFKKLVKTEKKEQDSQKNKRVFVLDFDGDSNASVVDSLRKEITAVLNFATEKDEVVVRLESPGGVVHGYGLGASQLKRIRDKKIPLTVSVDKVAASGGYLMACVADKIISAPFAIIGSIGVVAQVPNFHKILKKNDIDFELITAGEFKRTLTMFGENTDKAREKFTEQIEETHTLFKDFVNLNRNQIEIAKVATGEYWYGQKALELNLVDEIKTSDDLLLEKSLEAEIFEIRYKKKETLAEKINSSISLLIEKTISNLVFKQKNLH